MKNLTDYCNAMLLSLLGNPQLVSTWWTTPNRAFDMQCPADVPEKQVIAYLEGHCFGQ